MGAIFEDLESAEERQQRAFWGSKNTSIQKEETSSRMTNEREVKEKFENEPTGAWMPIVFQEEPGYAYHLFTPAAHRAWITEATAILKKWGFEGNGVNDRNLMLINSLIACSQGEAYDEGFESDDLHQKNQAEARWQQRHELMLILMTCRNASEILCKKSAPQLGGDDGQYVRAAAFRYNELNCWGDTGGPSEEYKHLKLLFELH